MDPSALRNHTPDEALIAYYDLISLDHTPINAPRLLEAAEYDPFLSSEGDPNPTQSLLNVALQLQVLLPDYRSMSQESLQEQRRLYKQRFGNEQTGALRDRFDYLRSDIILSSLVHIVEEDIVPVEALGTVTEAAAEAISIIEFPGGKTLPNLRRKALRQKFDPLSTHRDPSVRNRRTVVVAHLPATRGGRFAESIGRLGTFTGHRAS